MSEPPYRLRDRRMLVLVDRHLPPVAELLPDVQLARPAAPPPVPAGSDVQDQKHLLFYDGLKRVLLYTAVLGGALATGGVASAVATVIKSGGAAALWASAAEFAGGAGVLQGSRALARRVNWAEDKIHARLRQRASARRLQRHRAPA